MQNVQHLYNSDPDQQVVNGKQLIEDYNKLLIENVYWVNDVDDATPYTTGNAVNENFYWNYVKENFIFNENIKAYL